MVAEGTGGVMNTLEDLRVYFEAKGYLVRSYISPMSEEPTISVMGWRESGWINGVELYCYKSFWDVVNRGNDWILHRPMDEKLYFDRLAALVTVFENVIGPPIEEQT
jgi:hypothetical protein